MTEDDHEGVDRPTSERIQDNAHCCAAPLRPKATPGHRAADEVQKDFIALTLFKRFMVKLCYIILYTVYHICVLTNACF